MLVPRVEEGPIGGDARGARDGNAALELETLAHARAAIVRVAGERVERLLIADVHAEQRCCRTERGSVHVTIELDAGLVVPHDDWRERRIADHAVGRAKAS